MRTFQNSIEIFALSAIAVAYPIYDLLAQNPEFFTARNTRLGDLISLVVAVSVAMPLLLIGVQIALRRYSGRAGTSVHLTTLFMLTTLLVLPWLKRVDWLNDLGVVILALAAGVAVATVRHHSQIASSFLVALGPAVVVVPAFLLANTGVRHAVIPADSNVPAVEIPYAPTIVFIVFDEFPMVSLLDQDYRIDSVRYPNLAALAEGAYWFRNASTVSSSTTWAVPAIASGRYPTEVGAIPTVRFYPYNVFTMLRGTYRSHVFGRFLQLCPETDCIYDLDAWSESLWSLLLDTSIVYAHVVMPDRLSSLLPSVEGDWRNFRKARRFHSKSGESTFNYPHEEFHRFLRAIDGSSTGRLYFMHQMAPHMPFRYVPSGTRYDAPDYQGTQEGGAGLFLRASEGYANSVYQRHLLQVGFVDSLIGRLRDRLQELGIYDEAMIIITGDHGASYRSGVRRRNPDSNNYGDILLVPLIVKVPGQRTGVVVDRNVETIDILPTIADVLSIRVADDVDGRSLLDFEAPDRLVKTFVARGLTNVRIDSLDDAVDNSYLSWEQKISAFGARSRLGLYGIRATRSLVGTPAEEQSVGSASAISVKIVNRDEFESVDLNAAVVPLHLRGSLGTIEQRPAVLAIELNGIIAATTESFQQRGQWVFATMLPAEYLRQGQNRIRVFKVDNVAEGFVLHPLREE